MADYGLTPQGPRIKRLDVILDELHDDISEGWGVNTRLNSQSYFNVQTTAYGDKIAELWEFGLQIYHAMYPYSAETADLDNAVQYGGISREEARPTFYPIFCECVDGTTIPRGTRIRTSTNPTIEFSASAAVTVTRTAFNSTRIRIAALQADSAYTVALNGDLYSYTSIPGNDEQAILNGLAQIIIDEMPQSSADDGSGLVPAFEVTVTEDNRLIIRSNNLQRQHNMALSSNLTTQSVTGIVDFASLTDGEIALPNGVINQIVTAVPGLLNVVNQIPHIAGRLREDDVGLRQSYIDKIFLRSSRMVESIKSAILQNVQGINSVVVYQNDTNVVDADGREPHSVEAVVDGGSDREIATQINIKKAGGIQSFGSIEVTIPGLEGEPIIERFNRPQYVYVWFRLTLTLNPVEILPPNYVEAIKAIILDAMRTVPPGASIVPQRLIEGRIYANVPGIAFIETRTFASIDSGQQPDQYNIGAVPITARQRAISEDTRIEVLLGGY